MRIVFDHETLPDGTVVVEHSIETNDPAVQAMLTSAKAGLASQTTAGYGVITKRSDYPGKTRWQVILGEVVRLNDAAARGILGV